MSIREVMINTSHKLEIWNNLDATFTCLSGDNCPHFTPVQTCLSSSPLFLDYYLPLYISWPIPLNAFYHHMNWYVGRSVYKMYPVFPSLWSVSKPKCVLYCIHISVKYESEWRRKKKKSMNTEQWTSNEWQVTFIWYMYNVYCLWAFYVQILHLN